MRSELCYFKKLQQIQASHDEIKVYAGYYIDTLPSKEHAQKLGLKLKEVVQKLEEIIEFLWLIGV